MKPFMVNFHRDARLKKKVCELRQIRELKKKRRKGFPPADLHKHESLNFINALKSPTFVSLVIPASGA